MGYGVTHLYLFRSLDTRNYVSHITGRKLLPGIKVEFQHADFISMILFACRHEFNKVVFTYGPVYDFEICDNATERIENRIENQRLQRSLRIARRCRHTLHDGAKNLRHTFTRLAAGTYNLVTAATKQVYNLILHLVGIRAFQIHLVDYRYNLQV